MNRNRMVRTLLRFVRSDGGGAELLSTLLIAGAGVTAVGLSLPTLFNASDTAGRTFDNQVQILERGARTGATGRSSDPASGFDFGAAPAAPNYVGRASNVVGGAATPVSGAATPVSGAATPAGGTSTPTSGTTQLSSSQ